ncbi:hypothetical protein JYU34_013624 [Plutella xylostella]|uniref:Uncharacterized protein n=1 Tax=Plutella xylostella TaxID=51655 RepID=A0ABQ7QA95_PLUXY|nr:hypothetical protein JYU34_013624 [Plutella xylostella]
MIKTCLFISVCAMVNVLLVQARTEKEIREEFIQLGMECAKQHQVTPEEVQLMHQHVIPDGSGARCLVACVFKKKDLINDKGMLDIDAAHSMADKEHLDDPTMIENSKKLFDLCKSVNDETVSDGEKGCDRAALLSKCLIANYSKFGFKI